MFCGRSRGQPSRGRRDHDHGPPVGPAHHDFAGHHVLHGHDAHAHGNHPTTTTPTTTTPTTTATASPAQVLASAIFAAAGQRALDWRQTVTEGVDSYTQMTQAGRRDGTSAITVRVGKVVLRLNWALIGKTVYFTGNANALSGALGFTPTAAKQEAGKWISVTAAAGDLFSELSSYLTVSSITTSLDLVGEMTFLPATTVRGQAVLGIQGIRLSEEEKVDRDDLRKGHGRTTAGRAEPNRAGRHGLYVLRSLGATSQGQSATGRAEAVEDMVG